MSAVPADAAATNALIEEHLPLVRSVLSSVAARFPRHADRDELAQAATLGLVEAAHRYNPEYGVPFDRWVVLRIRGAILDAVRALDFAPRTLRASVRELQKAQVSLETKFQRTPTAVELAAELGVTLRELTELQGRLHGALVLSLDAPRAGDDGDGFTLGSTLVDTLGLDPLALLEEREQVSYVRDAVELLPERLRDVVVSYFLRGESSQLLAQRLGVTEARISQLRSEALALLRVAILEQYGELRPPAPPKQRARQDAFIEQVATQSSFKTRVSAVPAPRTQGAPVRLS